ncbi:hypothetical protein HBI46_110820 [Parastagonospora nodorum]|nr:hypothetical protein HBI46_110820 [Parastagonospora nodorum]
MGLGWRWEWRMGVVRCGRGRWGRWGSWGMWSPDRRFWSRRMRMGIFVWVQKRRSMMMKRSTRKMWKWMWMRLTKRERVAMTMCWIDCV